MESECVKTLETHPCVDVVTRDMCRWGMRVKDEMPEDPNQPYLVKKTNEVADIL